MERGRPTGARLLGSGQSWLFLNLYRDQQLLFVLVLSEAVLVFVLDGS